MVTTMHPKSRTLVDDILRSCRFIVEDAGDVSLET
jgi:hypothetical protein